jgi:beta-lactamase superfamily II metal-dependent hydrolase
MSWEQTELSVLHCDQGMGNLIKIYSDVMGTTVLTNLALIDLGSETRTKRFAGEAVERVIDALKEMESGGITPKIDLLVISHQDTDHWSLLPDLVVRIKKEFPAGIKVDKLVTGGQRWKPQAVSVLKMLQTEFNCVNASLPIAHCDYDTPAVGLRELWDLEGVKFRVLAANVLVSGSDESRIRNGTSAVIVVECGKNKFIIPGDATVDTVAFINALLTAYATHLGINPIATCYVLSAPHHGSLRTLADNYTTTNPVLNIATAFANFISARFVAASAGYLSHFRHPFKRVLDLLAIKGLSEAVAHDYVVYDDVTPAWEPVKNTNRDIFTTITSLGYPVGRQTWLFKVDPSGMRSFQSIQKGVPLETPPARLTALPARLRVQQGIRQPVAAVPVRAAQIPRRVVPGT